MRAFVVGVAFVAVACSSDSSREAPRAPAVVEPPPIVEPPKPPPDLSLGDGLAMNGVVRDGNLALVPIIATGPIESVPTLTLDEGVATGKVLVREMRGEWDVGTVRITNRSRMPLLVLRGEIITGARQDRVIAESQVILAGTTEEVSVRCVEEDRSEGGRRFKSAHAMAELELRRTVAHADQQAVWKSVAAINSRLAIREDTRSYRHAAARHATGENKERAERLAAQLAAHPEADRMVGVAVAIDGQVLAIDRFDSPALFQRLQPKLLGSYVASEGTGAVEGRRLSPEAVRALAAMPQATAATPESFEALRPLVEPAPKSVQRTTERLMDPWAN